MALTPEEEIAIKQDIRHGITVIVRLLKDIEKNMPTAIVSLNSAAPGTKKLLAAHTKLIEARQAFEATLKWDTVIKRNGK